jgi:hypothetical protein
MLVLCGLLVGRSALWMTLFYHWPAGDGALLYALRLMFGSAIIVSIALGFASIRRGDVMGHRAWMMRGYAIGLGAARRSWRYWRGSWSPARRLSSAKRCCWARAG